MFGAADPWDRRRLGVPGVRDAFAMPSGTPPAKREPAAPLLLIIGGAIRISLVCRRTAGTASLSGPPGNDSCVARSHPTARLSQGIITWNANHPVVARTAESKLAKQKPC